MRLSLDFLLSCTCRGMYGLHLRRHLQGIVKLGHSGINTNVGLAVCSTAEASCTRVYLWGQIVQNPTLLQLQLTCVKPAWISSRKISGCRVDMSLPTAHSPRGKYQIIHLPLKWRNQSVCAGAPVIDKH